MCKLGYTCHALVIFTTSFPSVGSLSNVNCLNPIKMLWPTMWTFDAKCCELPILLSLILFSPEICSIVWPHNIFHNQCMCTSQKIVACKRTSHASNIKLQPLIMFMVDSIQITLTLEPNSNVKAPPKNNIWNACYRGGLSILTQDNGFPLKCYHHVSFPHSLRPLVSHVESPFRQESPLRYSRPLRWTNERDVLERHFPLATTTQIRGGVSPMKQIPNHK